MLTVEDFIEMENLEKRYYSEEFITPYSEAYLWYKHHPHSLYIERVDGKIVGFINMFPIKENVYSLIDRGVYNDSNLTHNDIIPLNEISKGDNMFLSCIVVNKDYRGLGITNRLLQGAANIYREYAQRIDYIITDNVTGDGERFSRRLGLLVHCISTHDSVIFKGKYKDFVKNIK
ncbi:MAG: GNAT family N-acetyltransferase [Clostridium sp.]|uniref:GNAT family N-acetyltransferase n=1 Tax=Clostridium sp. TaxID=1506 RepID=UPI002FCB571D